LFNGRDGGGCAYQNITKRTTLQIDKHVRIRNFIEWEYWKYYSFLIPNVDECVKHSSKG
jgi:hypothetical protein